MSDRDELIAIANTYLQQGLLDHRPEEVLFADDCVRMEMGRETGGNAMQLRELLRGDAYKANKAIRDARWVVEAPFADVRYLLDIDGLPEPLRVATRFEIRAGAIRRIEILFDAGALTPVIVESLEALRTDR